MRFITQYSSHVYKSKSSAIRAGRNAIGDRFLVEAPEMGSRFDGCITIIADMINVEPCADGWRWSYTFDIDEVIVGVRNADGTVGEARYAEVAHWKGACTPTYIAYCYRNGIIESSEEAVMGTAKKRMQNTPLDGEQCELVRGILQNVLDALQDCGDNRYDAGSRVVVNLHKRDVSRLRSALKKL